MVTNAVGRAALLGAAAGARSATPLAVLAGHGANGWVKALSTVAATGELIVDKLPGTPSRLQPAPLAGRAAAGALAGGLDARRRHRGIVLAAVIGAGAAVGASYAGAFWRAYTARRGFALPGALIEDAVAIALASAGAGR